MEFESPLWEGISGHLLLKDGCTTLMKGVMLLYSLFRSYMWLKEVRIDVKIPKT
jgi:hypothetical protein